MAKQKLTPWFPPEVKPVHVGPYLRKGMGYSYWQGSYWMFSRPTPKEAAGQRRIRSTFSDLEWRGLANKPKGAA